MKNLACLFSSIIYFVSCSTNFSPIVDVSREYTVSIEPTGKSENGFIEFKFSNTINETLWFIGYSKNSPLYLTQIMSDTGWVYYGGWCGTGTKLFQFAPFKSFYLNVVAPSRNTTWRVGLYTLREVDGDGEYNWSDIQN
jgi:hypothetical protein